MAYKNLLFEFDASGTEGINITKPNEWNNISEHAKTLTNIKFKEQTASKNEINVKSIPSPFARMILFRNAFEDEFFPKDKKEEILEDILDAMEFIFMHKTSSYEDKLKVINVRLDDYSTNAHLNFTQKKYIKTLNDLSEQYQNEDKESFVKYNSFYVFYIKQGSDNYDNIIAGTSPYTGFFTPEKININIDGFFEHRHNRVNICERIIKPFGERNQLFLRYFNKFYKKLPYSARFFKKEIENLYKKLDGFDAGIGSESELTNEFNDPDTGDVNKVEIVPNLFYSVYDDTIKIKSFYRIKPSIKQYDEVKLSYLEELPLILVSNDTNKNYFDELKFPENWDNVLKEKIKEDKQRKFLPGTIKKYPWISPENDFFEDKLIKLPQRQDSVNMYDGKNEDNSNFQYLIPLTEKFFKYFKPDEIEQYLSYRVTSDDKNILTDFVEFKLEIPVDGNGRNDQKIVIKKRYSDENINYQSFSQDSRTKQITSRGLYSAIWPTLLEQVEGDKKQIERYYIIQYEHLNEVDKMWKDSRFFNYSPVKDTYQLDEIKNSPNHHDDLIKEYRNPNTRLYSTKYSPQLIQMVTHDNNKGFFLPKFTNVDYNLQSATKEMIVGIDFGTSNTVIAYKTDDVIYLMPITSTNFRKFYGDTLKEIPEIEFEKVINMFFIPMKHGSEKDGKPFSTEVCYLGNKEALKYPVLHSNITFKREIPSDTVNLIKTNLKWSTDDERNRELIKLFFNELRAIIEKQAIETGIPVSRVKYRYSYPLAFDKDQIANLKKIFEDFNLYNTPLDESQCAAKYFTEFEGEGFSTTNITPAITIDIGGGTADIVGYVNKKAMFKSSVLLGGQDIFNDVLKNNTINNPFVWSLSQFLLSHKDDAIRFVYMKEIFDKYLDSHSLFSYIVSKDEFRKVMNEIHNTEFYKYFRLTILYFYSAVFYYMAMNVRKYFDNENKDVNGITDIRIGIAGNGSKLLEWICRGEKWEDYLRTENLFQRFFNKIFTERIGINNDRFKLIIIQSKAPKQEVVKGLIIKNEEIENFVEGDKDSLIIGEKLGLKNQPFSVYTDDYSKINRSNYADLDFTDFENSEINNFHKTFLGCFREYSKELNDDFNRKYIEKFIDIFKEFDKNNIINEVNRSLENYFGKEDKKDARKEYKNSYFIAEIKGCLEIIKKTLRKDDFLGNKI